MIVVGLTSVVLLLTGNADTVETETYSPETKHYAVSSPVPFLAFLQPSRVVPLHDDNAIRLDVGETIGKRSVSVRVAANISGEHDAFG